MDTGYAEFYGKASAPWRTRPAAARALAIADKALVAGTAVAYVGALCRLAATHDARLWEALAVPAVGFVGVSALRARLNVPRPYEAHDIDPLAKKGTKGKSFPSRHLFSSAVISCALGRIWKPAGVVGAAATASIAYIRVAGGVHYPQDVIAGAALGALCDVAGNRLFERVGGLGE